ncbi:putative OsmC-like protein [Branchiibius hedensis]|uniref:Uncharacterized OsmC-related protein n=1 Tax=Branchiibius hedensis TaxID=672460 RepID=A0A2Y9A0J0_9MICO|nr:OsmC family protein [Branchiibius hedensis]PWJ27208.1 putative OsmC-like protein [Branchiibius hedensis]SSA36019.1 Uncharacterized OsmC-related protein [Branchiibius hedensis]
MTTVDELRALQAPLKEKYRSDPTSALTPIHATGDFRDPGITCTVDGFAGPVRAGLHRATGGDGSDACSGDLLLEALVACAGVTCRSVATAMRIDYAGAAIEASSDFDARGTLGLDRSVDVGVGPIRLTISLDTDADDATLAKLAELTERYCVVGQSLKSPPQVIVVRSRG